MSRSCRPRTSPGRERLLAVAAFLAAAACTSRAPQGGEPERPDIVVVLADDMGYSDIGSYGGEVRTPNLDSLAGNGLRFTQFYNAARCCPTRAALLTGLYPHQAGIGHMTHDDGEQRPGYRGELSADSVTLAEALRGAGYRTYMAGKWHVTRQVGYWSGEEDLRSKHNWPLQRGFDRFYGTIHGAGSYYDPVSLTESNEPVEPEGEHYYYTDAITREAVRFVREHRESAPDDPFFLYVAYTAPHWPLHALPEDVARYRGRYGEGWDALREERRRRMVELGLIDASAALTARDPDVPAWEAVQPAERAWFERAMEVYAAQIDRMDQGIGRLLGALEAGGRLDDTLILFLADNGGCAEVLSPSWRGLHIPGTTRDGSPVAVGNDVATPPGPEDSYQSYGPHWANASNAPFRLYKHWVHEGGIATPLIVHWPARLKRGGTIVDEVGHVVDVMATLLDAAGASYPEERQGHAVAPLAGVSLLPALEGEDFERGPIFFEHEGNRAVRTGRWKLVSRYPGPWELYDMEADRSETRDLAGEHPVEVERLSVLYRGWAERNDVLDWEEVLEARAVERKAREEAERPAR